MNQLVWYRTDLRVADHSGLSAAMAAGPTLALFTVTPAQWRAHDEAPAKIDFWHRNLQALGTALRRLRVPLLIRTEPDWAALPATLLALCREHAVDTVHVTEEYGYNERRRDRAVAATLAEAGIVLRPHADQVLFQPGSVLTRSGTPFRIFTPFRKVCRDRLATAPPTCRSVPRPQAPLALESDPLPAHLTDDPVPPAALRQRWPAGEAHAHRWLARFVENGMADYEALRNRPDLDGTSRLSPYLAAGVLSPRQCLQAALAFNRGEVDSGNGGAIAWIDELLWRDFYKHILVAFPRVSKGRAFRAATEAVRWRHAPADFAAWQQGRTGIPIVDAGMRQLLATGWMHNRLRMISAMFLSKNLLLDWRDGERWFMTHLIDGDLAANNGGWQWCASTGTDAAPYFRVFNPITQSRRLDPGGDFLRAWLPELRATSARAIHEPIAFGELPAGYPPPIVDLKFSRGRAIEVFRQLPP